MKTITTFPIFSESVVSEDPAQSEQCLAHLRSVVSDWGIRTDEVVILTRVSSDALAQWQQSPSDIKWDRDQLERMAVLSSIHQMLKHLLGEAQAIQTWLNFPQPSSPFNGLSPLKKMLCGAVIDLYEVENWLKCRIELSP